MSKKATAKTGRLVWIEPNKMDEISDTGTFDYEDYSICVDLEVRIPKRSACGNENDVITFHTNHETAKDRISFFTGTDGYLTTSFTDITAADPTSNKETLGVSSIDISYNSYFYPQVTIKFVDVRGSSLMYPQEDMFKNGSQGSFFKALFCFPYPQFILKVKGFYGKQVQYDLAVEDFRTSFNPESGNFECVVKFIGYMYGIYADLPMSYLIAAPYVDYGENNVGKDYWDQQVSKGIFVYDNGQPIDTFWQLRLKVKEASGKIKKSLQGTTNVNKKEEYLNETGKLDDIDSMLSQLFRHIATDNNAFYAYNKEHIIIYATNGITISEAHCNEWATLNERIAYYLNTFDNGIVIPYINDITSNKTQDILNKIIELKNRNLIYFYTDDFGDLLNRKYPSLKEQISNIPPSGTRVNYYVFKIHDIFNIIIDRKKDIIRLIDEIAKEIESETQSLYLQVLGFKPTLENIFRIIFAHMDTFMNLYYNVLKKINTQKLGYGRKPIDLGLTDVNSDIVRNENFVPPYPLVTKKENNKNETIWPGDYSPAVGMEELKLVERMFECIKIIRLEIDNFNKSFPPSIEGSEPQLLGIPNGEGTTYDINNITFNMLPATLSDLCYFENPYDCFKDKSKLSKNAIFSALGYRFKDMMNVTDGISRDTRGHIEAINFFKSVKYLNSSNANEREVINMLTTGVNGNGSANKSIVDEFMEYIKTDFNANTKIEFYHNKDLTGPIHINEFYPVNFNDISKVKKDNEQFFPKTRYKFTKIDSNNIGFFWDVMIKARNELTDKGFRDTYTKYWDRNYRMNDTWNMTAYSEEKGLDHFKGSMYKSLIYGSYHAYFYGDYVDTHISTNIKNNFIHGLFTVKDWGKDIKLHKSHNSGRPYYILKSFEYNSQFKIIYHTEDNYDAIQSYLKNKDVVRCYTVDPSIMKGSSLYGSPFFYMQNDNSGETIYNGVSYRSKDLAKGYMFLEACAPYSVYNFKYTDRVHILTKWTILLWGARLLRMSLDDDKDFLYVSKESGYIKPNKNNPMRVKDVNVRYERYGESKDRAVQMYIPGVSKNSGDYLNLNCFDDINTFNENDKNTLINLFLEWINTSNNDGFKQINDVLELKLGNGTPIGFNKFKEICDFCDKYQKIDKLYTKETFKKEYEEMIKSFSIGENEINYLFKSGTINGGKKRIYFSDIFDIIFTEENRNAYVLKSYQYTNGFYLCLNTKHSISERLTKYKFDTYVVSPIFACKALDANVESYFREIFDDFVIKLHDLYSKNNGYQTLGTELSTESDSGTTMTQIMLRNKDLKLSLYLTLKNLYDRWLCGMKRDRWSFELFKNKTDDIDNICEFNYFFYIDSFYNDIGSKTVVDIAKLNELIDSVITDRIGDESYSPKGMKFQGVSIYQFMSSVVQKNNMLFMAVPCFNRFKDEESIKELFTPFSWFDRGEPIKTSYIAIYPHQVSAHLDIEGANGYQYPNDGIDIADVNGDFKDTLDIPDLAIIDGGYTMPAFGVTYGKQDQSYFKRVTVNMDSPQVTEYSIGATLDIANSYGENQKVQTFVGQDLYKVYSNHSYTCTVEMMGNAMITPLMYFQLNNIPMFRGAYMIIKVEHTISQGNMTTVFTGVRMAKNKIPFVSPILEVEVDEDNSVDNGSGNNDTPTGTGGSNNSGGDSNTTVTPGTPEEVGENVSKVLKYARAAIGIVEYGYDINKRQSEQTMYNKDTAPNGWIKDYVPYPTKEKDPDGIYKPIQGNSANTAQWCCIFVSWCAMRAGISPALSTGTGGWYKGVNWDDKYNSLCDAVYNYYKKDAGRVIEVNTENLTNNPPQPGDFLLRKNTNTKDYPSKLFGHILLVESYNPETKKVTVIHGNAIQRVKREEISYDASKGAFVYDEGEKSCTCYCRPYYAGDTSSNVPSTGSTTPTPITQPSADTSVQSGDDIIITTAEDKIRLINAMIWKECSNINGQTGDTTTTYPAYGILQIRQMMLDDVRIIINKPPSRLKGPYLQNIDSLIPSENIDRDTQVQEFIAVMEWYNKPQNRKTYISNSSIEKDPTQISWSLKYCCAKWNGAVKGKPKEPANPNYFKDVKDKYNILKNDPTRMPKGNSDGWTPNAAFNSFFA